MLRWVYLVTLQLLKCKFDQWHASTVLYGDASVTIGGIACVKWFHGLSSGSITQESDLTRFKTLTSQPVQLISGLVLLSVVLILTEAYSFIQKYYLRVLHGFTTSRSHKYTHTHVTSALSVSHHLLEKLKKMSCDKITINQMINVFSLLRWFICPVDVTAQPSKPLQWPKPR